MIFVSTSCIKARRIGDAVRVLAQEGYRNLELSGGTQPYPGWKQDLLALRDEFGLVYRCHNYFPPPMQHFVLNLASASRDTRERTADFLLDALRHAADLGSDRFSYHAGFYVEIGAREIGKPIGTREMARVDEAEALYFEGHGRIAREAEGLGLRVFVENNVLGRANSKAFPGIPFMLLTWEDAERLRAKHAFDLLVDLAHLKVTCGSLGLDFSVQARHWLAASDYVHVSDNDGFEDINHGLEAGSDVLEALAGTRRSSRQITLEVYQDLPVIYRSHELVEGLDLP